jgi:hypothetical protein
MQKMMKRLRPYRLVILIVLPVILLVLIRALAPGRFKPDARNLAKASFTNANIIEPGQVAALNGKPLILKLVNGEIPNTPPGDTLVVPAGRLLEKDILKTIHAFEGPVLIYSADPAISAKAWMILTQMGYRDLFVLTDTEGNEVLKYKFRSDSTAGI